MKESATPSHHDVEEARGGDFPNETLKLLCERASCRNFLDKEIPRDVLEQVFESGTRAPSGGNLQPFSIIKVENPEAREKLAALCGEQPCIKHAPVDLLFCIDFHRLERWAELENAPFSCRHSFRHFWISLQDTVIAAQNMCTAADSLGLGSVYIGTVLECLEKLRSMFRLPPGVFPVVLLCLGYPKHPPKIRRKLATRAIVHEETYRELNDGELLALFDKKYPETKVQITGERLKSIESVCRVVHGEAFARRCIQRIRNVGFINTAQRYFGLHYTASKMPLGNMDFLKIMEESGCHWFKPWVPGEQEKSYVSLCSVPIPEAGARHLYDDMAWVWPVISPPADYEEEVNLFADIIQKKSKKEVKSLLHLGCGSGHEDLVFKRHFTVTGVDMSTPMLDMARTLNPVTEYHQGDMRSVRLGTRFDAVVITDAINYMLDKKDLEQAFMTAFEHLNPGGIFLTFAEELADQFEQNRTYCTIHSQGEMEITFIENAYDPDSDDTTFEDTLIYLIRQGGDLTAQADRHLIGLFDLKTWTSLLEKTGFELEAVDFEHPTSTESKFIPIFVCRKPFGPTD